MNPRFFDWIWHVRGKLALAPDQSSEDVFGKLDPLFHQPGTSHERTGDTLTFRKKDQAAQDKMSIFDSGVLQVEKDEAELVLRYDLISRALLYCFLAPLLFLSFAGVTLAINHFQKPSTEAASKSGKDSDKSKKSEKKKADVPMNPIDKFLGAPAPEKKDKDKKKDKAKGATKGKTKGKDDQDDEDDKKPSPVSAYVFAGIFFALYIVGRILEDRLIKAQFRKRLLGA